MKKLDLGQSFNTLANLGVIAGIIFLGYELNQTQRIAQAQMRNEISLAQQEITRGNLAGPMSAILFKVMIGGQVSELEEFQVGLWRNMWMRHYENIFFQWQEGLYSQESFEAISQTLRTDAGNAGYICQNQASFDPAFLAYAESVFEEPCG